MKAFTRVRRLATHERSEESRRGKVRAFAEIVRRVERAAPSAAAIEACFRAGLGPGSVPDVPADL